MIQTDRKKEQLRLIARIGVLSAVATILYFIEIPLWFAPAFYQFDLSDIVALIGGMVWGPIPAFFIELIKNLIHLAVKGVATAGVGELANFCVGVALTVPVSILMYRKKTLRRSILGAAVGTVVMVGVAAVLNYYVLIPFYANVFGMDGILYMAQEANANITDLKSLILWATTPFNLFKTVVDSILSILIFFRIRKFLLPEESEQTAPEQEP